MKFYSGIYLLMCITLLTGANPRQTTGPVPRNAAVEHVIWDGNRISTVHGNHGDVVSYHVTSESGLEWPQGSNKYAVFQSGLWIAAGKVNGVEEIRTAASEFQSGFVPGIVGGDSTSGHIYRIHREEIDAFLNNDWSTFVSMTLMLPVTLISGADIHTELVSTSLPTLDFMNWPVAEGAPWIDANGDGIYNPPDGDYPDISGDMFHWYVMNDADTTIQEPWPSSGSLNMTVNTSLFGFDNVPVLENVLFLKWKLINTGTDYLDSVFVSFWSDPDLGLHRNDLMGCVPDWNLGYIYNDFGGDPVYGSAPPAYGQVLLQTPIIPSLGDTAWVSGSPVADHRHLPMSSCVMYLNSSPQLIDPNTAEEAFRYMNGFIGRNGDPFIDPITGQPSPYVFNGDPVTGTGWVEYIYGQAGDHRIMVNTGPFAMAPGDSQEIVAAMILSPGNSNLNSLANLYSDAGIAHWIWNTGFQMLAYIPDVTEVLTPPAKTESVGPFTFEYQIKDSAAIWTSSKWFHYTTGASEDSILLVNITGDFWRTELPALMDITGTDTLSYWITLQSTDGIQVTWPFTAVSHPRTLIFGPDTIAPTLTEPNQLTDIHYLLPFYKTVTGIEVSDDRCGYHPPTLHWRVSQGDTQSVTMQSDTVLVYGSLIIRWNGTFQGQALALGDTIRYWVTVKDSSQHQNQRISTVKYFQATDAEAIGDWEAVDSYQEIADWHLFRHGQLAENFPSYPYTFHWGHVIGCSLSQNSQSADTLQYLRPLDLTAFDQVWLSTRFFCINFQHGNHGLVEISTDAITWSVIDSIASNTSIHYDTVHYSFEPYTTEESLYIRFRLLRASGNVQWVIDDVILHTDSTLVALQDNPLSIEQFALYQNHPNPFNPLTTIRYHLPVRSSVTLTIFNLRGQEVARLVDRIQLPGNHSVNWDAAMVASGIYFYRLETPEFRQTRKLVVVK